MTLDDCLDQLRREYPEFSRLYRDLEDQKKIGSALRIAVCGLMNAGKSSLLNALTRNLENEFFATKAVRATTVVQTLTHQGITYVDTPGIDVSSEDDEQAFRGLANADTILFVHNLKMGVLEKAEVDFLNELKSRRPDIEKCMLVVLTYAESATEQLRERVDSIAAILAPLFMTPRVMIPTSFTRYSKGIREGKSALINASGINDLHAHLGKFVVRDAVASVSPRQLREMRMRAEITTILDAAIREVKCKLMALEAEKQRDSKSLVDGVVRLVSVLRERISRCESV